MNAAPPILFSTDADGIGWITLDDPATRANLLNAAALDALTDALDAATRARPRALVVISGKENTFSAGADLKQVAALSHAAAAERFSRIGQKLFTRLADFPVPVVCAIHGICAGGGYELALACHWRLASNAALTRIGLPETCLGTIPGWGGGVRLARLIGAPAALAHILRAQLLSAPEAVRDGLVDEIAAAPELRRRAKAAALNLASSGRPSRLLPPATPRNFFTELREKTRAKSRGPQPALIAAIEVVERTAALALPAALAIETGVFARVTTGAVCKNLLHVFSVRESARKQTLAGWFDCAGSPVPDKPPCPIARVGIVGAGVMGSGIAHWLAAHGREVVLRDVQPDLVIRGLRTIRGLFDEAVARGKLSAADATTGFTRISATTDWDGFPTCDLVIEAIVENPAAKQALFRELARIVRPETLLASNTSALPIEEIAGHVPQPERTLGLHFFNPVSRMPLVEVVLGRQTSVATAERALALVRTLGKTPVVCRSSPGFLVTRVLFFYLNEAVRLWEDGVSTEALDAAARDFGWPMGPLRLIDEVGIDVTDSIFGELAHYFPERFAPSAACHRLLATGLKGRKNGAGAGFYRHDTPAEIVNDTVTRALIPAPVPWQRPSVEITDHLMGVMQGEAQRCLDEGVVLTPDVIDFALVSGTGFPVFHGGLMRWVPRAPQLTPEVPA